MSRVTRLARILRVFSRYRLDEFIDEQHLPAPARFGLAIAPWRLLPSPDLSRGARLLPAGVPYELA